ncbi:DHHC palmitoyltransferase-domain-containing protein [Zychaea mexicana]|uniref:DHHC palmitoyltransferase-domain-containing protein n=1 Tax=Zychaea mexicana TaxID=64656 RepID=UPI0022FEA1FA|nr:DHHC palmitoyltransferase-domain-containing protein [Zychaea mexicana]KAI9495525.1 DHHC palmitoyltransferase-domain-containing protein [Zychaea mexicana]
MNGCRRSSKSHGECFTLSGCKHNTMRVLNVAPVMLLGLIFLWCYWAYHFRLCGKLLADGRIAQGALYVVFFQPFFFLCIWSFYKTISTSPGRPLDVINDRESQDEDREDVQLLNAGEQQQNHNHDDDEELGDEDNEEAQRRQSIAILNVEAAGESRTSLARPSSSHDRYINNSSNNSASNMRNVYPLITVKRSGGKRFCSKCRVEKFDRTHHCRMCKSCILKMDHHCPWVNNCVGYFNYKFFYLFILYATLVCIYVFSTTLPPTIEMLNGPMSIFGLDFNWPVLLFVSGLFGVFLVPFTIFHTRQILKNRTTIEFYEKANFKLGRTANGRVDVMRSQYFNPWDLGTKQNFIQVMGANSAKWFLPVGKPRGKGNHFPISEYAYNTLSTDADDQLDSF